ncbi:MAG: HAD family phosphatase [Gammaproteobacteria bacterium]|nr:HAD family phosphatase [Gammaproteobacteria bacterium]
MERPTKLYRPTALIFDLDGLLLDTETIARNAFLDACNEVGWEQTDFDVYVQCIGRHGPEIGDVLKAGYGSDFPWEEIGPITQRRYHEYIDHKPADIKPGASEILAFAEECGIPCGLATSSRHPTTNSKLSLSNLREFFSIVVTGDDVGQSKPHPEPYLLTAKRLNVSANECWALEDSENGVRSAVSAGCIVFQVPDLVQPSPQLRRLGHQVVDSLHDVLAVLKQAQNLE